MKYATYPFCSDVISSLLDEELWEVYRQIGSRLNASKCRLNIKIDRKLIG